MRRIVLLLASMALAVIWGSGVALADSPTTKADCKNGGYAKYGFNSQGECIGAVKNGSPADITPPETTIVDASEDPLGTVNFVHESSEPNSTFECRLMPDSEAWVPCGTTKSYTLPDSDHMLYHEVRAIDAAGNVDPTPATYEFYIDTTPPDTNITSTQINGNDVTFEMEKVGLDLTEQGEGSVFWCKLEPVDTDFSPCDSPKSYTDLEDGEYTFKVAAMDGSGNLDPTPAEHTFTVDSPPVFNLPDTLGPFENRSATVEWTTSEPVHSVKCELYLNQSNGEVVQIDIDTVCSTPKTYQGINPGTYTFIVSGRDSSNQLSEPYEVQFEVI